jgi:hypothetical protein
VLTEPRKEGFQPFMVCQTRVRHEDRRDHTKRMLRLRHASQINGAYEVLHGFNRVQDLRDAMPGRP